MLTFSKSPRYRLFLRHLQTIASLRNQALDGVDLNLVPGQVVGLRVEAVAGVEVVTFLAVVRERNQLVRPEKRKEGLALEQAMAAQTQVRPLVRTEPVARQGMAREEPLDSCRHNQISISRMSLYYCVDT
jgi:hypothetical protein